ncbi:MAG: hypothetical protein ACYTEX_27400 [Planctomycetota bacterium]
MKKSKATAGKVKTGLIPTRKALADSEVAAVAQKTAGNLMANWGLSNAKRVALEMRRQLADEGDKRSKKKDGQKRKAEKKDGQKRKAELRSGQVPLVNKGPELGVQGVGDGGCESSS